MTKIYKQITDLIGKTPLVELGKYSASKGLENPIIAKVEFFNPGGSVKDRIAFAMIEDAEKKGLLKPGATSSNLPVVILASVWHWYQPSRAITSSSPCLRP